MTGYWGLPRPQELSGADGPGCCTDSMHPHLGACSLCITVREACAWPGCRREEDASALQLVLTLLRNLLAVPDNVGWLGLSGCGLFPGTGLKCQIAR